MESFVRRHIGISTSDEKKILETLGCKSTEEFLQKTSPSAIRTKHELDLPSGVSEFEALHELRSLAAQNSVWRSYIGTGYYGTITPPILQRQIL